MPAGRLTCWAWNTNVSSGHSSRLTLRVNQAMGWAPPSVTVEGMISLTWNPEVPKTLTRITSGCAVLTCRCEWGLIKIIGETGGGGGGGGVTGVAAPTLTGCSGKN